MYYCAQDILEYLMNSVGGGAQDSEHRLLRSAAVHAYRDVMNARDWHWHISEATLEDDSTVGSGTGTLSFTLPANVKSIDNLVPAWDNATPTAYLSPTDWFRVNRKLPQLDSPVYWTVISDPAIPGRWLLKLAGSPNTSRVYRFTYRRRPKPLQYFGFEPECRGLTPLVANAGMVRRVGTASEYPDGLGGRNRIIAEEIIGIVNSVVPYNDEDYNDGLAVHSDRVDASDGMFTAILSGAEVWMAKMMGKNVEGALAVYNRDLRMAFEADVVAPLSGRGDGVSVSRARAAGYYSPSGPDT
jgi:hypothetical protein